MKKLANLKGVKALNKNEQKNVNGGAHPMCDSHYDCPGGMGCCDGICMPDSFFVDGNCGPDC